MALVVFLTNASPLSIVEAPQSCWRKGTLTVSTNPSLALLKKSLNCMGFNMGPVEGCGKFSKSALVLLRRRSTQRTFQVPIKSCRIWYCFCMDIDLTGFSTAQQQALFDLLILSMYADGHLSTVEDEQLQKLLAAMGFTDEIDRQREFDAAVTRIRPSIQSVYKAKEQALLLAAAFTVRSQQKQVFEAVEHIMTFDKHVSTWENTLLMELRMKFRL